MERREKLIASLRERGFRITPQRLAIIDLLRESDHPSAEQLYDALSREYPMLSRATVYNTLEVLKELGEIAEIHIKPTMALYDPEAAPHYHFLCRRCGRVIDVAPLPEYDLEGLSDDLTQGELRGYGIDRVQVHLWGTCPPCSGEKKEV